MICFHRKYRLGDEHSFLSVGSLEEEINKKGVIVLPLYLYDHSGITMRTTPFSCRWDSGQVGYIYVTREEILKCFSVKRVTKKLKESIKKELEQEVKSYDYYIRGEVYRFILERETFCKHCKETATEEIDSCCGFYGKDFIEKIFEQVNLSKEEIKNLKDVTN